MKKTLLNARVNLIYYLLMIIVSFFSRKIFLDFLKPDFVGLTSTLQSILGFLNLAELGVGVAIGQVLYKPLFDDDKQKINEILSLYGYLYRKIGFFILVVGVLVSFFLPIIFDKTIFNLGIIYLAYYAYLGSSLLSYFFNFQQTLLQADQKGYLVQKYFQAFIIFKLVLQMTLVYFTQNYYLWIIIELLGGISYTIILKWRMEKEYSWMNISVKDGKLYVKKYRDVLTKVKQLFVHKLSLFALTSTSPLIIYAFVSLKYVAYYGNYLLIFGKMTGLISTVLGSSWAGVGNLVAEGDDKNIQKVFWELNALRFWIAGFLFMTLYYLTDSFITLWIGDEYLLSSSILIMMLVHLFMMQVRGPIDNFIYAYGLFSDIWAPVVEGIINITVAIIGGKYFGIVGIVAGTVVSMLVIVFGWKPYFLFQKGFKIPVSFYFKNAIILVLSFLMTWFIVDWIVFKFIESQSGIDGYLDWIVYAMSVSFLVISLWTSTLILISKGMRDLTNRLILPIKDKFLRHVISR